MKIIKILKAVGLLRLATVLVLIYPVSLFSAICASFFLFALLDLITGQDIMSGPARVLGMSGLALFGTYALVMTLFLRKSTLVLLGLVIGLAIYIAGVIGMGFIERPTGIWAFVFTMPIGVVLIHIYLISVCKLKNRA